MLTFSRAKLEPPTFNRHLSTVPTIVTAPTFCASRDLGFPMGSAH